MTIRCGISGQYLFFDLVSVLSGFSVTGFSGAISGRKLMDTAAMAVLSGNIVEVSGGMYRANLYAEDTSGSYLGYFFTASGCYPRSFSVITDLATSGRTQPASGAHVTVPPATLSGVTAAAVTVQSGQLSGHQVDLLSGRSYTASGIFAVATASVASGGVYLASGHFLFGSGTYFLASGTQVGTLSGSLSGQRVNANVRWYNDAPVISGIRSGATVVDLHYVSGEVAALTSGVVAPASGTLYLGSGHPATLYSGQTALVYSGQLSGQPITLLSGRSYPASGVFTVTEIGSGTVYLASGHAGYHSGLTQIASGPFVNATATVASGAVYLASGHFLFGSGQFYLASGQEVNVYSGQLSGQFVNVHSGQVRPASGTTFIASGPFVNATATVTSGAVYLASGHFLFGSGQFYLASGQEVLVYSGQLSGQPITLLSGRSYPASGVFTVATATVASGDVYLASGHFLFGSGQFYLASGHAGYHSGLTQIASGPFVNATATVASGSVYLASGHAGYHSGLTQIASGPFAVVPPATLSGVVVDVLSGTVRPASGSVHVASGSITSGVINSGVFVTATATVASGGVYLASGHFLFGSGQYFLASGQEVNVYSGQLSGQPITLLSGRSYTASGIFTAGAALSGQVYLASGHQVFIQSGALSGQKVDLLSGNQVQVWSGTQVNVFSGSLHLASGSLVTNAFGSGVLFNVASDVLTRDFTSFSGRIASGLSGRCLLQAARKLTNKWDTAAESGVLAVYQEDDSSVAYRQAITELSGAAPITALDSV